MWAEARDTVTLLRVMDDLRPALSQPGSRLPLPHSAQASPTVQPLQARPGEVQGVLWSEPHPDEVLGLRIHH